MTQIAIKQELDDHIESRKIYKDIKESLSNKVQTLMRKIQDVSTSRLENLHLPQKDKELVDKILATGSVQSMHQRVRTYPFLRLLLIQPTRRNLKTFPY